MKKMVRCSACGYIMEEQKLGAKCPACGAPKTAFRPFEDPVAYPRRRLLNIHLHPIAVHFPTAFSVAVLVLAIAAGFLAGTAGDLLFSTLKILALFIPLTVIVSAVAGYIDGKVRFRRIKNSSILKQKILFAAVYLVVSAALAGVVWTQGFEQGIFVLLAVLLAAAEVVLSIILGLLGTSLTEALFPGK
jgi:hypothetical protein